MPTPKTMRAAQFSRAKGPLEIVERPVPEPGAGEVRLKVEACGVCHSDVVVQQGLFPGIQYPRIPGHEVIGVVDAPGAGVTTFKAGERVGVGWHGGSCHHCDNCRRGDFFACQTSTKLTGITSDGGYAEYMVAPADALARVPEELDSLEGAPLLCAGVTTFNALRKSSARPGDLVAVLGLGGLGHLGVQFAAKMGMKTVAIARGADKEPLAKKLGAWRYLDSQKCDPATELGKLGGARAVLATITDGDAMGAVMGGLAAHGTFLICGAPPSLTISPYLLISGRRNVTGCYSGTSIDSQDALAFSVREDVRSMNETFPLARATEAFERMLSGKARFRVVLDTTAN